MRLIHPFRLVYRSDARILILGTMPSPASVDAGGYYGHPRNAFWQIMDDLLGGDEPVSLDDLRWDARYDILRKNGVALWDVLRSCVRPGSADADIREARPNRFNTLLSSPDLRHVAFNGKTAARLFGEYVRPAGELRQEVYILPSTSGAYPMPYEDKLAEWRAALEIVEDDP